MSKYILSIFNLIALLNNPDKKRHGKAIAYYLKCDIRTVYRYLNTLQTLGYEIDRDFDGNYFIVSGTGPKI